LVAQLSFMTDTSVHSPIQLLLIFNQFLFNFLKYLLNLHYCLLLGHVITELPLLPIVLLFSYALKILLCSKDEKKLDELLNNNFIQPSVNLFASHVLLVKKKR
jgi:hypothetical protein